MWKLPQMPPCSANNANLDKNNVDMFYKIDCCAAIHGCIWMNNVPNESRIIMLSCTEISFVIYLFSILRNFKSNPGLLFKKLTLYNSYCTIKGKSSSERSPNFNWASHFQSGASSQNNPTHGHTLWIAMCL